MKTNGERQNVMSKMRRFTRKCTHYTVTDNNRADLLADYAQIARQFGAKGRLPRATTHILAFGLGVLLISIFEANLTMYQNAISLSYGSGGKE